MKRKLFETLLLWKKERVHKPIVLRGARQVGKSFLVREFGKTFKTFVEIDFELAKDIAGLFNQNLDPERIIREISLLKEVKIVPGETLLFFDEVQECPESIKSLRYFYEMMPELHLIAAGSLLDFTLENIGLPVGRVMPLYLYPLSFNEFVELRGALEMLQFAADTFPNPVSAPIHSQLISLVGEYIAIGGMPEVVFKWIEEKDFKKCRQIQAQLVDVYRTDFEKYAKSHQIKYVDLLYSSIAPLIGKKFVYSQIGSPYKSRELSPALDLLEKAGIIHKIYHSSASTPPLKSQLRLQFFKVILSDIGIMQALLNKNSVQWLINPKEAAKDSGDLVEAFVGQEILASASPYQRCELFYWARTKKGSLAEIDYLFEKDDKILPIEVKAGKSTKLESLRIYLQEKKTITHGIHFSQLNSEKKQSVIRLPLYFTGKIAELSQHCF